MTRYSFFHYNVTKPYPFVWFTPAAVIAFATALPICTFFNFTLNGYYLVNEVSTNPNATISHGTWLQKLPSVLTDRVHPICQPALLSPQNAVFTNQTALTYNIQSIQVVTNTTEEILSSLEYNNNVLENCSIGQIDINLEMDDRLANQIGYTMWGQTVRTYLSCHVRIPRGLIRVNLTQTYDYVPENTPILVGRNFRGLSFLSRDEISRAALWWGESLMSWWWMALSWNMEKTSGNTSIRKGVISFTRTDRTDDPTSLDFFDARYWFLNLNHTVYWTQGTTRVAELNGVQVPNVWLYADSLAKSTFFTVLTDLGQAGIGSADDVLDPIGNILLNPVLLQQFSANITEYWNYGIAANAPGGPATGPFDPSNVESQRQMFNASRSVISTSYLCSVPRMKSLGSIAVSVLIANFVFLGACWNIFKFVVDSFILREEEISAIRTRPTTMPGPPPIKTASVGAAYTWLRANIGNEGDTSGRKRPGFHRASSSQATLLGDMRSHQSHDSS